MKPYYAKAPMKMEVTSVPRWNRAERKRKRKVGLPSGGVKEVPPLALLISIWLWDTGVIAKKVPKTAFSTLTEKLCQSLNAFSNAP